MTRRPARIAVVRQFYFPLDTRVRREVDALLDEGHQVEVFCLARSGEPLWERRGALTIWRLPFRHRRGPALAYLFEHAAFVIVAGVLVGIRHLRRRFDVVQANSIPDTVVFAALVPRLTGARVLLDLHECMPEFMATRFGRTPSSPFVRLVAAMEQASIRFAHRTITCTQQMREAFIGRGADPARMVVVHNSSDERIFRPAPGPEAARDGGGFRLICHGSIEDRYGLDTVIRAVALLRNALPDLGFDVYGEGSQREELVALARELGVEDRVRFSDGFVGLEELVWAIGHADAGVVAMKRDEFRDLTHCNKMFDFFSMRRPAIVSWTRSVAAYFDDNAVEFFRADDPADLAQAIRRLHDDPQRRAALVEGAARENEPYRWPRQRQVYLSVIDDVVAVYAGPPPGRVGGAVSVVRRRSSRRIRRPWSARSSARAASSSMRGARSKALSM
jgi:glycosyltransferase involved in cell wall biosynthesis